MDDCREMERPLVTIAIPTYNRAETYLRGVVSSALGQTYRNLEVIVGDNASTDSTPAVIAEFKDDRLRHLRQRENIGANGNFNCLLEEAKGHWFLLLHDDDLIDADFVESCLSARTPGIDYGFIRTGVRAIDAQGKTLKESPNRVTGNRPEDLYRAWFGARTGLFLCNTLYSTQALRDIGGFSSLHDLLEDNYALVRILADRPWLDVPKVHASYRYTYDQRTYQVPVREWCEDFKVLLQMIVAQSDEEHRSELRNIGKRFFGQLCVRRANAIESPWNRAKARLTVARHFGWSNLRSTWTLQRSPK